MKFTKLFETLTALLLLFCFSLQADFRHIKLEKSDKQIAKYVTRMMETYHYSQAKMDDEMSKKIFDEYFRYLDSNKRIFLKQDIEEFQKYQISLDDMFKVGDLTFPAKLYRRFIERLEERVDFTKKRLVQPFDFTKVEDYQLDRSEASWASSVEELNDIWRKHLKNDMIRFDLLRMAEKEHSEKKALSIKKDADQSAKDDKPGESTKSDESDQASKKLSREETVLKKYEKLLKIHQESDRENFLEMALNVMTKCFDPHSNYFAARAQEEFEMQMKLSLDGIGATLMEDDGYTKVTSLIRGGPAHKGKELKKGDRIIAVAQGKEEPVSAIDMRLSDVVSMIRGKRGTEVVLHVVRGGVNGTKHIISIIRDKVKLEALEAKGEIKEVKIDETKTKIGVIDIPSFYVDWEARNAGREGKRLTSDVKKILTDQIKKGIDALIIDLRNNGGGSLPEAISLTGLFIDKGPVVQIRQSGKRIMVRNDEDPGVIWDGPLLVLVNEGSASASEIFAAAIQDYKRGVIVGTRKTHGKGTVQQVQSLDRISVFTKAPDIKPGQVKYTMAKFYRINGSSTQQKGITPDIIFPSYAEYADHGEATLRNVLKWDEIRGLNVEQYETIKSIIPQLREKSEYRRQVSKDFQDLSSDIEYFKNRMDIKKVSLNEQARIEEFKKDKEIRENREKLAKRLFSQGEDDENEQAIKDDVYLRESLLIVSDLKHLQKEQVSK